MYVSPCFDVVPPVFFSFFSAAPTSAPAMAESWKAIRFFLDKAFHDLRHTHASMYQFVAAVIGVVVVAVKSTRFFVLLFGNESLLFLDIAVLDTCSRTVYDVLGMCLFHTINKPFFLRVHVWCIRSYQIIALVVESTQVLSVFSAVGPNSSVC